ncbi:cation diffusion facilitator family transporter [bacterium]|nr:MAG: cation diffusion facilitator family transporter [bacterium]
MAHDSTSHVWQSLFANLAIAVAKGVAAAVTGSGAMLAETIHTAADCGNQVLLLVGIRQSRRPPDASHPLGYGRRLYFWSFIVALMLFLGGGVFSVYEGLHKWGHPEAIESVALAVGILLFSLVLEGWALYGNVVEMGKRRGPIPFFDYLRMTKDSDLVVVFGENAAAVLGLVFALAAVGAASATGDPRWDAAGSVAVGAVLVAVSVFLAVEVESLLIGESADPDLEAAVARAAAADPRLRKVYEVIGVQQGPGETLCALKVRCDPALTVGELHDAIEGFEARLRKDRPGTKWVFIEPDLSGQ